jgi:hypothetical protein
MFHDSGKINTYNYRIWGSENLRESPKVEMFCSNKESMNGHFFFMDTAITGIVPHYQWKSH